MLSGELCGPVFCSDPRLSSVLSPAAGFTTSPVLQWLPAAARRAADDDAAVYLSCITAGAQKPPPLPLLLLPRLSSPPAELGCRETQWTLSILPAVRLSSACTDDGPRHCMQNSMVWGLTCITPNLRSPPRIHWKLITIHGRCSRQAAWMESPAPWEWCSLVSQGDQTSWLVHTDRISLVPMQQLTWYELLQYMLY